jgi:hypothetical protein
MRTILILILASAVCSCTNNQVKQAVAAPDDSSIIHQIDSMEGTYGRVSEVVVCDTIESTPAVAKKVYKTKIDLQFNFKAARNNPFFDDWPSGLRRDSIAYIGGDSYIDSGSIYYPGVAGNKPLHLNIDTSSYIMFSSFDWDTQQMVTIYNSRSLQVSDSGKIVCEIDTCGNLAIYDSLRTIHVLINVLKGKNSW